MDATKLQSFSFTATKFIYQKNGNELLSLGNIIATATGTRCNPNIRFDARWGGESSCTINSQPKQTQDNDRCVYLCLRHETIKIIVYYLCKGNYGITAENAKSYSVPSQKTDSESACIPQSIVTLLTTDIGEYFTTGRKPNKI